MSMQTTTAEHGAWLLPKEYAEPKPGPEHEWLWQFVGEWETEAECRAEMGNPPMKTKGTESVRSIDGLWVVAESKSTIMNKPVTSILTLGYDFEQKKYVGTWVGSCMAYLWKYEGSVDPAAQTLTLLTEGPCPQFPGTATRFKEVMEFKSKDHRVFTSFMQTPDGKWAAFATVKYRRKKQTAPRVTETAF